MQAVASRQDEVSAVVQPDRLREVFEEALRGRYSFLSIDFRNFRDHPAEAFKACTNRALNINRA